MILNACVAVGLLEQRGFSVDVANDGREAIVLHEMAKQVRAVATALL